VRNPRASFASWASAIGLSLSGAATVRSLVVDANDGIIATAGIVEGFAGAGATRSTILIAAFSAMVAGGIALAGAKYAEEAADRDAQLALIEEERQQLARAPEEEIAELVALYEAKGLSPHLAREVATELTAGDPLAAHIDAEHGLSLVAGPPAPLVSAVAGGLAFAVGSGIPLLTVVLAPDTWRIAVTFVAVIASLAVTSVIVAKADRTQVAPTLVRTVLVGVAAMLLTLVGGSLFAPG
jgi:VIT1/CCC1 family predicted Fe2+/Mn2+ transporter